MLSADSKSPIEKDEIVSGALKLGKQAYLQRRITSEESIGKLMFSNGFKLASNRGLVRGGTDMKAARMGFVRELNDITHRLRQVGEIVNEKRLTSSPETGTTILSVVGKD